MKKNLRQYFVNAADMVVLFSLITSQFFGAARPVFASGDPHFNLGRNTNFLHLYSWPLGATLTVSFDDPANGPGIDFQITPIAVSENAFNVYFDGEFDVDAGYIVTVTDGITSLTHVVKNLDILSANPDTNIVTGIAEPGTAVFIGSFDINSPLIGQMVNPDPNGNWEVDFSSDDLQPGYNIVAMQSDGYGNSTQWDFHVPNPRVSVGISGGDWITAYDWPVGTLLTMTIDGSGPFEATTGPDLMVDFDLGSFHLQSGQAITITGGSPAIVLTYTLPNIAITGFGPSANTITGTATPGAEVRVCVRVSGKCVDRYVTANEDGNWMVDYNGIAVIKPGSTRIWVRESDINGNSTQSNWRNPFFWVWPNDGASIETLDWPVGAELALTIDNPETPENPDYGPYVETVGTPPWPNPPAGQTYAGFDFPFDIPPGYVVTITDGTMTRTHTVAVLEVQDVDPDTDAIAGIATPNATVEIEDFYQTTVDDYGHWSADISDFYDILPDTTFIQVGIPDDDGDLTFSGGTADCCHIIAFTSPNGVINRVGAFGWPIGAQLTLTIEGVEGSFPATLMDDGSANFNLSGFEFQPGQLITVMDDSVPPITRTYTPTDISITGFDIGANMLLGEAAPDAKIRACFGASPITCVARYDIADVNGNWSIDYSGLGVIPGSTTIRISESELSHLHVRGNRTHFGWRNPFFWVWPKNGASIETLEWPMGDELTMTIDNPGTQANPDYGPYTETVGTPPWPNPPAGQTYAHFQLPLEIPAGYVITITNGVMTRTHTVTSLEITDVNPDTNIVTGVATPFSQIEIDMPEFQAATADENGNWSVDFSGIYDIVPGTFVEAFENDDDGDFTAAGKEAFEPNQPPIAETGGSYTVEWGATLTLDGSGSTDPDNNIVTYEWDLDNDGEFDDASGVTVTTSFNQTGDHIVGLRVTDDGGLSDTDTTTVTVLPWTLKGFYQPVDMNGVYNLVKGGSTVPLKFEIFAVSTELTDIASVKSLTYAQTSCDTNVITDEIETTATGNTSLRYADGQFIYNWKTPKSAGKCYRLTMTVMDGSSLVAYFKFK